MIGALLLTSCLLAPVQAPVADPFREPACTWCPGNRGIEYDTTPGQRVVAAAPGAVTFAGLVAGVRYVVVRHADGMLATYGRLATSSVASGALVSSGDDIGTASERLHFGLRRDGRYVDPAPYLATPWRRPALLPLDGSPGRVARAGTCSAGLAPTPARAPPAPIVRW